jgi:hydroxyethylthiazole kinase-like uncharacterized protein yjeF
MSTPLEITPELLRAMPLPDPADDADKDARGRVLAVGGSVGLPGAVVLAGLAALRGGAGKLKLGVGRSLAIPVGLAVLEALVIGLPETSDGGVSRTAAEVLVPRLSGCDAVLVGPGMIDDEEVAALLRALLAGAGEAGFVLDATALPRLLDLSGDLARLAGRAVITPHAGEMASLLDVPKDEVEQRPLELARSTAEQLGVVVILKGAVTHIAAPDGRAWVNRIGSKGLATSGSGDTLAGLVTGLLARGAAPEQAAAWGVHIHARAGLRLSETVGPLGFLARELPDAFPGLLAEIGS